MQQFQNRRTPQDLGPRHVNDFEYFDQIQAFPFDSFVDYGVLPEQTTVFRLGQSTDTD